MNPKIDPALNTVRLEVKTCSYFQMHTVIVNLGALDMRIEAFVTCLCRQDSNFGLAWDKYESRLVRYSIVGNTLTHPIVISNLTSGGSAR